MVTLRIVYGVLGFAGLVLFAYAWWAIIWIGMLSIIGTSFALLFMGLVLALLYTSCTGKFSLLAPVFFLGIIILEMYDVRNTKNSNREFCKELVNECEIINGEFRCSSTSGLHGFERTCNEIL